MSDPLARDVRFAALRREIAAIEASGAGMREGSRPFGGEGEAFRRGEGRRRIALDHGAVDAALGGGLVTGALHEILPAAIADSAAAGGFALALALSLAPAERPLVWIRAEAAMRESGVLHGDGLAALGLDPDRLILVRLGDAVSILRAGVDVARCAALGAVIVELWGDPKTLDLTSERRLLLAAEQSGATVLLLRPGARTLPGGAETRWRLRSSAARPLPGNAPGPPTFELTLLRHRHGPPGGPWRLAWNRDAKCFEPQPAGTETLLRDPHAVPRLEPAAPAAGRLLRRHAG